MTPGQARKGLLALIGHNRPDHPLPALDDMAGWTALAQAAADYRMEPWLWGRISRQELSAPVPEPFREAWKLAHRTAALDHLSLERELRRIGVAFDAAGLQALALKGPWLARHAYAHPAERPMRDLDLLVPRQDLPKAWRILAAAGWRGAPANSTEMLAKHLPPLFAASGVMVELHGDAWEASEALEWGAPPLESAAMMERGNRSQYAGIAWPDPADMLSHLIIHGVYTHRLDVGPQLLVDVGRLLDSATMDWATFHARARSGGWSRAAGLVLSLTDRWARPGTLEEACPTEWPDDQALGDAEAVLVQDPEQRRAMAFAVSIGEAWRAGGVRGLARRIVSRISPSADAEDGAASGSRFGQATRYARTLIRPSLRRRAMASIRLGDWVFDRD